jgi:hypothetical protein
MALSRLIAYLFVGSFCAAGPLCLIVAGGSAMQRLSLVYSGQRTEGIVIAKRQSGSTRVSYAPVFQFTASDGRRYTVNSDIYSQEADFSFGEHVPVLYPPGHPDSARIDAFAQLWMYPLAFGGVGAAFSAIPTLLLLSRMRRQSRSAEPDAADSTYDATETASPGLRRALGVLLGGTGFVLLAIGLGVIRLNPEALHGSRVVTVSAGALLAACGVLMGPWVTSGSRLYYLFGGAAISSMAVLFGWVSIYGDPAGFSGGVSIGGTAVRLGGSVTLARVVFGIGSTLLALASLWMWKQAVQGAPRHAETTARER